MRISKKDLLLKLSHLDQRIMGLWISQEMDLNDDEIWDLFVLLLETRVELLKACKDAGVVMAPEICLPQWLAKLTNAHKETRLHELKKLSQKQLDLGKYRAYESIARLETEE